MSSGDLSRNIGLGRVEFSRHVWRPLNSSNYELRRPVEKYWTWSGRIFSTRLETLNSSNYELRRPVEKYWTWSGRIFSARLETPLFVEL
jgi:hypothetical protein